MNVLEQHAIDLMKKDPVAIAEKVLGRDNPDAVGLAILLNQSLAQDKADALSVLGDTHFHMSYSDCVAVLARAGFEKVYTEMHGDLADVFEIWWHADGVLLTSESYDQRRVNKLQVYYNWRTADRARGYEFTSSGGWYPVSANSAEFVWSGYYDGREGMLTHLKRLRENGQLLSTWVEQPFLWFLNYSDTKNEDYDYQAINRLKYAVLPEHVQAAIGALPVR